MSVPFHSIISGLNYQACLHTLCQS